MSSKMQTPIKYLLMTNNIREQIDEYSGPLQVKLKSNKLIAAVSNIECKFQTNEIWSCDTQLLHSFCAYENGSSSTPKWPEITQA